MIVLKILIIFVSQLQFICITSTESSIKVPNLPADHLVRYFKSFPKLKDECLMTDEKYFSSINSTVNGSQKCWGYEYNCKASSRFQTPTCTMTQNMQSQIDTFYYQADFGYIKHQINELKMICVPKDKSSDSSLECTKYLRFCRGHQLIFDFRELSKRTELIRYHTDVLRPKQILGHCQLNRSALNAEMDHMGALQSWAPELRNFDELLKPIHIDVDEQCDLVINEPIIIMKIDAMYNMYHHFCDFFNLYASFFVNQSHPIVFDANTRILIWETYPYDSPFAITFKAFTQHRVWTLNDVKGKRVCFRNVMLPLLPRMIFGLYYNTPIVNGCRNSGLFRAFSEFILHRLNISYYHPLEKNKLRITYLARRTKYRRVLNEDDLLKEISANNNYSVTRVYFERPLTFTEQLTITRNTDIFIGMHGAGLTHLLFLPDWASIFELYNCDDVNCYKDLARLRGINYITWERHDLVYPEDEGHHPENGAHAKFTNYIFDRMEFARLVSKAAAHVLQHKDYLEAQNRKAIETNEHKLYIVKNEL